MSDERRWPAAARAAALTFAGATLLLLAQRWLLDVRWDRFQLPAFDGHVYYTMAELPGVFSVTPWGYRVLTPWLAALLPTLQLTLAFALLTLGGLAATAALLVALGRVLGGRPAALAALALLFVVSAGTREILGYQILVDPLALALGCGVLLAAACGAGLGTLAWLLLFASAAKEANLVLLPAVVTLLAAHRGWRRGLRDTGVSALPAIVFLATLRLLWTPQLSRLPALDLAGAASRVTATPGLGSDVPWLVLALAAAIGCVVGRGPRLPWLLAAGATLMAPYLNPDDFSAADLVRLRTYAWPGLVGLALRPFGTSLPAAPRGGRTWVAWVLALVLATAPAALVDRYRRLDLSAERDALLVRTTLRGTFDAARRLAAGEGVSADPQRPPRIAGREARPRWYLGLGWTPAQRAGSEAPWLPEHGVLIVPAPGQLAVRVRLGLEAARPARLAAWLDEERLPEAEIAEGSGEVVFVLAAAWLGRGDHALRLARTGGPVRLERYTLEPDAGVAEASGDSLQK